MQPEQIASFERLLRDFRKAESIIPSARGHIFYQLKGDTEVLSRDILLFNVKPYESWNEDV